MRVCFKTGRIKCKCQTPTSAEGGKEPQCDMTAIGNSARGNNVSSQALVAWRILGKLNPGVAMGHHIACFVHVLW